MEYAQILLTRPPRPESSRWERIIYRGGDRWDWNWVGDSPVALINWCDLKKLEQVRDTVPWQFEVVDYDSVRNLATIVRTDTGVPYYAYYRFEKDVRAIAHGLTWLGTRMVLLAQRWGWAYVPPGEMISWRHLGKSRPPKKALTIDIDLSLPDHFVETIQQLEERLLEVFASVAIEAGEQREEDLVERLTQAAIASLSPGWNGIITRQTEPIWVESVSDRGEMNISVVGLCHNHFGGAGSGGSSFTSDGQAPPAQHQAPIACNGCKHYHGAVYNGIPFVCAMHPYGVESDVCSDHEGSDRTGYYCNVCEEWHE
jgi:hypothetical protein